MALGMKVYVCKHERVWAVETSRAEAELLNPKWTSNRPQPWFSPARNSELNEWELWSGYRH